MKASTLPTLLLALGRSHSIGESDAVLLDHFTNGGDQEAFTQLVHRYARLVWRVARTRCRIEATAEDVFQATFVVLAKRAASIRSAGTLAGWLHRTAHRLAVKATRAEARPKPERVQPKQTDALDALSARELLATVDDELAKLTDAERTVLILCGVDGEPLDDVATRLGCSSTVVKGRLQRARAKLRTRLEARGLTLPAVLIGLFAAPSLSTIQAAVNSATTSTYSLAVSTLIAEGINMKVTMMKAALTLALCGMAVTLGGWTGNTTPSPNATAAPLPKPDKDGGLIWILNSVTGKLKAFTPDGKKQVELDLPDGEHFLGFTRDGTKITFAGKDGKLAEKGAKDSLTLHLRDVNDSTEGYDTKLEHKWNDGWNLSPDMKRVIRFRMDGKAKMSNTLIDLATKKETSIDLPDDYLVLRWVSDGTGWYAKHYNTGKDPKLPAYVWYKVSASDFKRTRITPLTHSIFNLSPSPDGKSFIGTGQPFPEPETELFGYYRFESGTGKTTPFNKEKGLLMNSSAHWSPDGTQVVTASYELLGSGKAAKIGPTRIIVHDADGENPRELQTIAGDELATGVVGWFPTPKAKPVREQINAPLPKPKFEWKEGKTIELDGKRITGVAYSSDGKQIAIAQDAGLTVYDVASQKMGTLTPVGKQPTHRGLAFSPNGDRVAVTVKDGVSIYETANGKRIESWEVKGFDPHQVIYFTGKDGREHLVATNGEVTNRPDASKAENGFKGWAENRHKPCVLAAMPGKESWLMACDNFGKDADKTDIFVWTPSEIENRTRLLGHKHRPVAAVVSTDGKRIVSADVVGTLIAWESEKDTFKKKVRIELGEGVQQLALAADGKTVAAVRARNNTKGVGPGGRALVNLELYVFDISETDTQLNPIWAERDLISDNKEIVGPFSLAFSPNGKKLLAAFADPYILDKGAKSMGIKVWELVQLK